MQMIAAAGLFQDFADDFAAQPGMRFDFWRIPIVRTV